MVLGNTLNILRPPDRSTPPIQTGWNEDLVKNMHNVLGQMQQQISATTGVSTASLTSFATKAALEAATVPLVVDTLQLTGHTTAGDGGAALYKRVVAEPSHALKITSADGAFWEGVVSFMTPEMFGAVGDGSTDDLTKLQAMFDCPVSDSIMFGTGKTYYFETNGEPDNLIVTRGMQLYMNGSLLHHKRIGGSNNRGLSFKTTMGAEETWTETITEFADVLTITTALAVGTELFIGLGEHPNDNTIAHSNIWATITANSGTSITIDKPVPFDITGTGHSLFPVTPHEGSNIIDTLRIISIGNNSSALYLESVRNFSCENFEAIDVALGLGIVIGCENINIGIMTGKGRLEGSSSTRAFTSWGSKAISIGILDWTHLQYNRSIIFIEGGTTDVFIGKLIVNRVLSQTATADIIHCTGFGDLHIGQLTLTSNHSDRLIFEAPDPFRVSVNDLVLWTDMTKFPLRQIKRADRLKYQGKHFVDKVQLYKRFFVTDSPSFNVDWFYGVPLRVFVRIDDPTSIEALNIRFEDDTVTDIRTGTAGNWVDFTFDLPGKALLLGTKFRIAINGKTASSAVVDLFVEYWKDPDRTELSGVASWDENRGEFTDTTDGSGDITIPHALGAKPRVGHIQMQGTTDYNATLTGKGSTNLLVRIFDAAGAAVTSTSVTVSWSAAL